MRDKPEVVCVGILVADIISGALPRLPRPGELMLTERILLSAGGLPVNAAVSLTRLGFEAGVVGKVGKDPLGPFIVDYLKEQKVDTRGIRSSKEASTSSTMIILTESEDRRFIHTLGASADFSIDDLDFEYIRGAKVLYLGGYFAMPRLTQSSLVKLFKFAREGKTITVLDVVAPHSGVNLLAQCREVLKYTDVFLPNDDEARIITGESDPLKQAEVFLKFNPEMTVVITMGRKGSLARTRDKIVRASVYPVKVVDPSGGGDAFDAGFIVGLLKGWDVEQTLKFASAIGASSVTAMGCTTGIFTMKEALNFIKDNTLKIEVENRSLLIG